MGTTTDAIIQARVRTSDVAERKYFPIPPRPRTLVRDFVVPELLGQECLVSRIEDRAIHVAGICGHLQTRCGFACRAHFGSGPACGDVGPSNCSSLGWEVIPNDKATAVTSGYPESELALNNFSESVSI